MRARANTVVGFLPQIAAKSTYANVIQELDINIIFADAKNKLLCD